MKLPALLLILSASALLAWEDDCLLDPVVTKVGDNTFFSTGGSALTVGRHKCIEVLMRDMDEEQAEEYFEFNLIRL